MLRTIRFAALTSILLALIGLRQAFAQSEPDVRAEQLIARANELHLADHRFWRLLLHYHRPFLRTGLRSFAKGGDFFLSPDGPFDPQAELEETIRAWFLPLELGEKHPRCRFIARYRWLAEELKPERGMPPDLRCERFEVWREALSPKQLTLVYPASYLNNPASSFGHTFLRLDPAHGRQEAPLLSYAVNFAAATAEEPGLLYGLKGIFGLYAGRFSVEPYYIKVRQYSDIENRDIWEYRLNFNQAEINRMIEHLWELGGIDFSYYFFDENCSFHLLSLLEAARPELHLTDRFPFWAIPIDTVRAALTQPGAMEQADFRPAASTILHHHAEESSPQAVEFAQRIAAGEIRASEAPFSSSTERLEALELAQDFLAYQSFSSAEGAGPIEQRAREAAIARSTLLEASPFSALPAPRVRPDEGHRSSRIFIGGGIDNDQGALELNYRGAYHDLLDPPAGYPPGMQIELGSFTFQMRDEALDLKEIAPVSVLSISPQDPFIKPLSWKFDLRIFKQDLERGFEEEKGAAAEAGVGAASELFGGLVYLLFDAAHEQFPAYKTNYALGVGPEAGAVFPLGDRTQLLISAAELRFGLGDEHNRLELKCGAGYRIAQDLALRVELSKTEAFDEEEFEAIGGLSFFY